MDDLSLASARLMSSVQTRELRPETESPDLYLKAFRSWDTESQAIDAKIATYFVDGEKLAVDWRTFVEAMRLYHNLPGQQNAGAAREATVAALVNYARVPALKDALAQHPERASGDLAYRAARVKLKYALIARRDEIVSSLVHQRSAG